MFIASAVIKGIRVTAKATSRFTAAQALLETNPKAKGIITAELVAGNGGYVETNRRVTLQGADGEWRTM